MPSTSLPTDSSSALSSSSAPLVSPVDDAPDTLPETLRCPVSDRPSGIRLAVRKKKDYRPRVCNHLWEPVPLRRGRYGCAKCGAVGRKVEDADQRKRLQAKRIAPRSGVWAFRCSATAGGNRCRACATERVHGEWRCPLHAEEGLPRAKLSALRRLATREGPATRVRASPSETRASSDSGLFGWGRT